MGRERNLKRGQKESTEGVGTLAEYGLLEIRGTEHFNANKITFVKCLLKNEKSLSALAGRLDYLGKSSFRGVWKRETPFQYNEIKPTFY